MLCSLCSGKQKGWLITGKNRKRRDDTGAEEKNQKRLPNKLIFIKFDHPFLKNALQKRFHMKTGHTNQPTLCVNVPLDSI